MNTQSTLGLLAFLLLGSAGLAQESNATSVQSRVIMFDPSLLQVIWIAFCAGLVLLMQPGFALLESGLVQRRISCCTPPEKPFVELVEP